MKKKIFEMSNGGKSEYCCTVVKIGELHPIKNSDFLAQTFIGDASLVIRKDQVKEGDLLFYASNECQLNEKFLSINNLFGIDCYEKNSNSEEVREILGKVSSYDKLLSSTNDTNKDEIISKRDEYKTLAKSKCGFFAHNGRVRMIKLKQTISMGYLFSIDEMSKYCPKAKNINMEDYLNTDFDTVDGELFVKAYVPPIKTNSSERKNRLVKRNKKIKRFDRMIEGEFSFHYDTNQLSHNMYKITPTDDVVVSVKLHGTSLICSKCKIKNPLNIAFYKRWWNRLVDITGKFTNTRFTDYVIEYDNVYSSRTVIRNQYINENVSSGYYDFDIWKEANDVIKNYISEDMTVYCEICGYANDKMIQKGYDYGCKQGEFFIMPYRITTKLDNGSKYEWNVTEVYDWTEKLIIEHPYVANKVHPIDILYHGTLANLYPNLSLTEHWNDDVLHAMMNDKEHFGMEELEPMCKTKVPREGVVLRIDNDPIAEAFKLKCKNFLYNESKNLENNGPDIEMVETYIN